MKGKIFIDTNSAAAYNAKADKILTEDLNHGQIIEGILIENPFISGEFKFK